MDRMDMKISKIKTGLKAYDGESGALRKLIPEPHIQKLRKFCEEVDKGKDRSLTAKELLKLVTIILGKKTWDGRDGSTTLRVLADNLGGLENLRYLQEQGQLTETNVELLEQYKEHADFVTPFLVLISKELPSAETILPAALENTNLSFLSIKLAYIKQLVEAKILNEATFSLILGNEKPQPTCDILLILKKHGLAKNENVERLSGVQDKLSFLASILTAIQAADSRLMLQTNLTALIELGELLEKVSGIIKQLAKSKQLNQMNLDKIFANTHSLKTALYVQELLKAFRLAGWDIAHNLNAILNVGLNGVSIKIAIESLVKLALKPDHVQLVLDIIFEHPDYYRNVIEGVGKLIIDESEPIDQDDLKIVLSVPESSRNLAVAIRTLNERKINNPECRELVFKFPKYADSMAMAVGQLQEVGHNTSETRDLLLENPENSIFVVVILERFIASGLFSKDNPKSVSNFKQLYEKKLINQEFIIILIKLQKAKKLDQNNLEMIFENPSTASELAMILIGEEANESTAELKKAQIIIPTQIMERGKAKIGDRDRFFTAKEKEGNSLKSSEEEDTDYSAYSASDSDDDETADEGKPSGLWRFISGLVDDVDGRNYKSSSVERENYTP